MLPALAPIRKNLIGLFIYDKGADGVNNLTAPIPYYHAVTFMSGIDFYMPAADPPDGTISIVVTPRWGGGKTQVINLPNWASSAHAISIVVNDYVQDIDSWTKYVPRQARGSPRISLGLYSPHIPKKDMYRTVRQKASHWK